MPYVQLNSAGTVTAAADYPQVFTTEFLAENDAKVVAFRASMAPVQTISFLQFMALFTSAEQAALVNSTDTQVKLFVMMATGSGGIQLSNPEVAAGVNYCVSINLLTAPRGTQILSGASPPSS